MRGDLRYSASTLSQDMAVQETSYMRFSSIRCMEAMGRNGRNALDASTESMFPKLDDAVIFMYFIILAYIFRPSITPRSSTMRSFSSSTTPAVSFAMSTAVSTDIPTSAALMAAASFMPSPMKPTLWPRSRSTLTILAF